MAEEGVSSVEVQSMPTTVADLSGTINTRSSNMYSNSRSMETSYQDSEVSPYGSTLTLPTFLGEAASPRNTIRIRIENDTSKRSKDLIKDVKRSTNLFDAVYDNPAVKKAHVRKWNSEIAKKVKSKELEIRCSIWDETKGMPWHSFSVEELKTTSTRRLLELAPESDVIKLVLQCVERPNDETSEAKREVEPSMQQPAAPTTEPAISSMVR